MTENQNIEYKESWRDEYLKWVCGFANAQGGTLYIGRSDKGKVKLHQATNMTLAGAAGGSFWGLLIGMIFLMPLAGVLAGTAGGAIGGALTDIGIDNKMMKEMGGSLKPGGSALCVLVRKATEDKVLESLAPFAGKGKVFKTSLTADNEEALRNALEKAQA